MRWGPSTSNEDLADALKDMFERNKLMRFLINDEADIISEAAARIREIEE
jgi:hypothetical protein